MPKMKKISRTVGTGLIYLTNRIQDLKWTISWETTASFGPEGKRTKVFLQPDVFSIYV